MSMESDLNPHEKSMQFLREICNIDGIELIDSNSIYKIFVRVRGRSGRHYEVEASRPIGLFLQTPWTTEVTGAAWKRDFDSEKTRAYTAKLCLNIHSDKEHLPVGDRLASLALSLHNDIKLAMEIPLVAQFIVCPREELYHVFKFQEELVVTQDMIDESAHDGNPQHVLDYMEEEREIEYIDFLPDFWHFDSDDEPFELDSIQTNWLQDISDDIMQRFD
ncbi:MAG: hypothetical protein ACPHM4_02450 [Candidatus Poseidoniaceae archaeon]